MSRNRLRKRPLSSPSSEHTLLAQVPYQGTWYRQRQATVAKSLTNLNPNNFVLVGNYHLPKDYLKFVELVPKSADKRALLCKIVPTSIEVFVSVKCFRLFFGQVMLAHTTQEFAEGLFRAEKKR